MAVRASFAFPGALDMQTRGLLTKIKGRVADCMDKLSQISISPTDNSEVQNVLTKAEEDVVSFTTTLDRIKLKSLIADVAVVFQEVEAVRLKLQDLRKAYPDKSPVKIDNGM